MFRRGRADLRESLITVAKGTQGPSTVLGMTKVSLINIPWALTLLHVHPLLLSYLLISFKGFSTAFQSQH